MVGGINTEDACGLPRPERCEAWGLGDGDKRVLKHEEAKTWKVTAVRLQRGTDTQTEIPNDVHPTWNTSASASQCKLPLPSLGGEILRSWGYILFTLLCSGPRRTHVGLGPQ